MTKELLGEIVTWDVKASEVNIDVIRNALRDSGLPVDVAGDLNNRSAFSRATKHLKEDRTIDKVKEAKDGSITFQLTRKSNNGNLIDFDYECQVELNVDTGEITCKENKDIEHAARELLEHALKVRSANDITRMVQKLHKDHADLFPINPARGVAYFTPASHAAFTAKIEKFLHLVGGVLWRFPVPKGTEEGNRSVKEAVNSGLESLLKELNDSVAEWDGDTRPKTMERAVDKFQAIAYKVDVYADYLASSQDALKAKLEEAKKSMMEKIMAAQEPAAA